MKNMMDVFAPSGCEQQMSEFLMHLFEGKADEIETDVTGNLIVRFGDGRTCIECGMDSVGVMVVSMKDGAVRFAPVGKVDAKKLVDRVVIFENGAKGTICCDEEKTAENAKVSDLYAEVDGDVKVGEFGVVDSEFSVEEDGCCGYGLTERIALAAVCKAVEKSQGNPDVTLLFSAQKRLGGRGLRAFFGINSFDRVITVDSTEKEGCVIVAKDERSVSNVDLRRAFESIVKEDGIDAKTVVTDEQFWLEQIAVTNGAPCCALGISAEREAGKKDFVRAEAFESAVRLLTAVMEKRI